MEDKCSLSVLPRFGVQLLTRIRRTLSVAGCGILLIGLSSTMAAAQDVGGDWKSLLRALLAEDAALAARRAAVEVENSAVLSNYLDYLPDITFAATLGGHGIALPKSASKELRSFNSASFDSDKPDNEDTINKFTWSINGRLNLLNGGSDIFNTIAQQKRQDAAVNDYNAAISDVIRRGLVYYSLYFNNNRKFQLLTNRVRLLDERLKSISNLVRNGQASSFQQWEAEIATQLAREEVAAIKAEYEESRAGFYRFFRRSIDAKSLMPLTLPESKIPVAREEAELLFRSNNFILRSIALQNELNQLELNAEYGNFVPDVDFYARYEDNTNPTALSIGEHELYEFGIEARMNIGKVPAEVTRLLSARSASEQSRNQIIEQQREAIYNFESAWHRYNTSKEQLAILQASVSNNQRIVEAQRRATRSGASDAITVLDIEVRFSNLLERQIDAEINHHRATIELMRLINLLTPRGLELRS